MEGSSQDSKEHKTGFQIKNAKPPIFKSWLLFFIVATLGGALVGAIVGGIVGGVMGLMGATLDRIGYVGQILGYIVSIPVSYFSFVWSVNKFIVSKPN